MRPANLIDRARDGARSVGDRLRPGAGLPASKRRGLTSQVLTVGEQPVAKPELVAKRDELARRFAALQADLGGLAYEMASRDHFRLDLLVKAAAPLQQVDSELGQVERLLRMEDTGAAGSCPSCGGLQARGAVFCWRCGKEMTPAGETAPALAVVKG